MLYNVPSAWTLESSSLVLCVYLWQLCVDFPPPPGPPEKPSPVKPCPCLLSISNAKKPPKIKAPHELKNVATVHLKTVLEQSIVLVFINA